MIVRDLLTFLLASLLFGLGLAPSDASANDDAIFWTDIGTRKIQRSDPDGGNVVDILQGGRVADPLVVAIDEAAGKLYWTLSNAGSFQRSNLDGTNVEWMSTFATGRGLALDPVEGKMYWTAILAVKRSDLDGSNTELLVNLGSPKGIALDLGAGKMYWADTDDGGVIRRANLDGSDLEIIVSQDVVEPYGVALDVAAGKVYWTDLAATHQIRRANLDGSGVEDLVSGLTSPEGIVLDVGADKMYWTDSGTGKIQRANLDGTAIEDIATGQDDLYGLAIHFGDDDLYWTGPNHIEKIQRSKLDGSEPVDIFVKDIFPIGGISADPIARKIYWPDLRGIVRADFDGKNLQTIIEGEIDRWTGIEIDAVSGTIYWTEPLEGRVMRADLDGSDVGEVISGLKTGSFDVDVGAGKIYVTKGYPGPILEGDIVRYDLDGTFEGTLVSGVELPRALRVDSGIGKIYWAEGGYDAEERMRRADLDGSNPETVFAYVGWKPEIGIDAANAKLYFTTGFSIMRTELDGSSEETLVSDLIESSGLHLAFGLAEAELQCRFGNVNAGAGKVADALFLNGSAGDADRIVDVDAGALLWTAMLLPPRGGNGKFLVHANANAPTEPTVTPLPGNIGSFCFPILLGGGATPIAIWNGIGKRSAVGHSIYFDGSSIPDPSPAPEIFLQLPEGDATHLPPGTVVTFQGVIFDPAALAPRGVAVTNAGVVRVL